DEAPIQLQTISNSEQIANMVSQRIILSSLAAFILNPLSVSGQVPFEKGKAVCTSPTSDCIEVTCPEEFGPTALQYCADYCQWAVVKQAKCCAAPDNKGDLWCTQGS
ncbi:hypothetical protein BUE80_DR005450, partial [Diplocarpon rosae]